MVQILEGNPGAGTRFAQGIGRGLSGDSQSLVSKFGQAMGQRKLQEQQQLQQQQQKLQLQEQMQAENETAERLGIDIAGLTDPKMRLKAMEMGLKKLADAESAEKKFQLEMQKDQFKQNAENKKNQDIKNTEQEEQQTTQNAFNRMVDLIPKVGKASTWKNVFGSESFGEFSSLTGALEALLVDKVNKGTLSDTRFRYITETLLPKPHDSQAEIKGKLKGLASILNLDPSALEKTGKKSKKQSEKQSLDEIFG